jgi:hypothetical protein
MMPGNKTQGAWGVRVLIRLFTVVLAVLVFWLLGFLVEDVESIRGPDYDDIEQKHVDLALVTRHENVAKQIADLDREINNKREQQRLIGEGSQNLQRTINQLLELQKLSIEKAVSLSESEKSNLSTSLTRFLESQKTFQDLTQTIGGLTSKRLMLDEENRRIEQQIEQQKVPAQKEYQKLSEAHRLKLALYQLLILVPILLIAGYLLIRLRRSIYFPLVLAFGAATLIKVGLVIHEYFPSQYFKYVLILLLLGVVARILVHFIRTIAFPKMDWLIRQYRDAYERFLCPICEYPIRTGPRKFLYWTRRTVHRILPPADSPGKEEPYTCPSCGTLLLEPCPACQNVRHSLLSHCQHCGAKKEIQ